MTDKNLKPEQRIKQKLKMAPRVLEYLKILEMPIFELKDYLKQITEGNPFIRYTDEEKALSETETYEYESIESDEGDRRLILENTIKQPKRSLQGLLLEQLRLLSENEEDEKLGEILIGEIDENGLLLTPIIEIAKWYKVDEKKLERVLEKVIQNMEPVGVGARSVEEAIEIQLKDAGFNHHNLKRLVNYYIKNPTKQYSEIFRRLKVDEEDFNRFKELIKTFKPYPAKDIDKEERLKEWELEALKKDNRLKVRLNPRALPGIIVKREYYNEMINSPGITKEDLDFIRSTFRQARDINWTVNRRFQTLLEVAQAVIDNQPDFLKYGPKGIKPLKMEDIADKLSTSISTVSRAVSSKYIKTPHGILPMKIFFTGRVGKSSQREIMEVIKEIIENESKKRPLSDIEILDKLKEGGYNIKRRTIAKYRITLGIPSFWKRKLLYKRIGRL
ncbi:MAG: RNA polymerase factor sigma-54 [bacterium]